MQAEAASRRWLIQALGALGQPMQTDAFQAVLLSGHKENAAEVPFDPAERWSLAVQQLRPGRRGFPVHASLNGKPFDTAIVSRSRRFWLLVPADISDAANVAVGQSGFFTIAPETPFKPAPLRGVGKAS